MVIKNRTLNNLDFLFSNYFLAPDVEIKFRNCVFTDINFFCKYDMPEFVFSKCTIINCNLSFQKENKKPYHTNVFKDCILRNSKIQAHNCIFRDSALFDVEIDTRDLYLDSCCHFCLRTKTKNRQFKLKIANVKQQNNFVAETDFYALKIKDSFVFYNPKNGQLTIDNETWHILSWKSIYKNNNTTKKQSNVLNILQTKFN